MVEEEDATAGRSGGDTESFSKKKKEKRQRKKKKSQDEASLAPSRANIEEDEGGAVVRVSPATRGWAITGGMLRVVHGLVRVVLCEDIHI
ncbi:hypothetical protein YC2023_015035 [Brassica napus]